MGLNWYPKTGHVSGYFSWCFLAIKFGLDFVHKEVKNGRRISGTIADLNERLKLASDGVQIGSESWWQMTPETSGEHEGGHCQAESKNRPTLKLIYVPLLGESERYLVSVLIPGIRSHFLITSSTKSSPILIATKQQEKYTETWPVFAHQLSPFWCPKFSYIRC